MGQIKFIDSNASDSSETIEGYQKHPLMGHPHDTGGPQWTDYAPPRGDWQHADPQMLRQLDDRHDT